ncbi:MAG TPA: hypothetical protein VL981_04250 [Candidatus Methylacidiphilales bacterium]|nr:hypothetical protein [Candidatus Methylacidiphilales bacterium]
MDFLFSTKRINRLAYFWRHLLFLVIVTLALALTGTENLVQGQIIKTGAPFSARLYPVLSAVLIVLGLYYYVRFAMLPRMNSLGMSPWHAFCLIFFTAIVLLGSGYALKYASQNGISIIVWLYLPLVLTILVFHLALLILPEGTFREGDVVQVIVYFLEVGGGRFLIFLVPSLVGFAFLLLFYDFWFYRGLDDAQSMDNAQLARQIVRKEGFTTEFLRPYAVAQLHAYVSKSRSLNEGSGVLFPPTRFPPGTPRVLPDTYNAPGYPCLLAAWFWIIKPQFNQTLDDMIKKRFYPGERWIPEFNQIFVALTLLMIFALGRRLFDNRVAWSSVTTFLLTDTVWRYSVTALSTCLLMFLVTAALACAVEVFLISEKKADQEAQNEEGSLAPAWPWLFLLGLLLAAACVTRLHLLILLVPMLLFFIAMPRVHPAMFAAVAIVAIIPSALWFLRTYHISGNIVGSNLPLLLYSGEDHYKGNEIYCATAIPSYDALFKDAGTKEYAGFLWHFQRGWYLIGSNPMVLLAFTAFLHRFKRSRVRAFQLLVAGCLLGLVAANNLCVTQPDVVDAWNVVILMLPALTVLGSAFFFILLDRMELQVQLLRTLIIVFTFALAFLPMSSTLTTPYRFSYNFPPYLPPVIKQTASLADPDEWVTTDMPWGTAWYADRVSLWLPDLVADFENFHDNLCPTGILLLTPITLEQPLADLQTGEFKEWYPLAFENNIPSNFPLGEHAIYQPPGLGPSSNHSMWSDRARWKIQPY